MKNATYDIFQNIGYYKSGMIIACFCLFFITANKLTATTYYVSTTGSNSNAGTSESSAWKTITYAATMIQEGDTVYIKAGEYSLTNNGLKENVVFNTSGTAAAPIQFIGYKTTPGDILGNDYEFGDTLSSSDMPLLDGGDRATAGTAIKLTGYDYIIVKNIQIQNYTSGVIAEACENCVIENVITINLGDPNAYFSGFGVKVGSLGYYNIIRGCITANSSAQGISAGGDFNLIEDCQVYCNDTRSQDAATDYYILIRGNYNTVNNCYIERINGEFEDVPHPGHGYHIVHDSEYNVVKNSVAVNLGTGFACRHDGAKYNLIENCVAYGSEYATATRPARGLAIMDGASYNTFRNCRTVGVGEAIAFFYYDEDDITGYSGRYNTFENCILEDTIYNCISFHYYNFNGECAAAYNDFINCTINGGDYLFKVDRQNYGNILTNCIITNVNNFAVYNYKDGNGNYYTLNYTSSYSNFYNNGFTPPSGAGNFSSNPLFLDANNGDYRLNILSPCIDAGTTVSLDFDYNHNKRPYGSYYDVGAHEYSAKSEFVSLKLNENTGSTTSDEMENISAGTINGAAWATGISGSCLNFDGTSDYVNFGNSSVLNLTGSRSMSAWINPNSKTSYKCIIGKSMWRVSLFLSYGQLRAIIEGSATDADSISNETVTNGEWQHVAMTFDIDGDKKIHLYINGKEVTYFRQIALVGSTVNTASNFLIGSDLGANHWFDGIIDEIKVFGKALTEKEIFDQYATVFSVNFNEKIGNNVNDSSLNKNNGNIIGAQWVTGISGSALGFDGINDDVDFGNPFSLDLTGSRSMSAWVKPDTNSPYKCIVAKSMWKASLFLSYGKLRAIIDGSITDADSISNETVKNGEWQHVAMTFDINGDKKIYLYINGQEVTYSRQNALSGSVSSTSAHDFTIGSDVGINYWFDGIIDEVKIFRRTLNNQEIFDEYKDLSAFSVDLNEGTGTTAKDNSIYGNNGIVDGASWVAGKSGQALDFDGVDDYIDFGNPGILDLPGSRSMSAWIKPNTNSPYKCIIAKSMWKGSIFLSYGKLRAIVDGNVTDADSISNETVSTGTWQHVAMTFDINGDKKIHLYINGQEVTYSRQNVLVGSPVSTSAHNFTIGSDVGINYWFDGIIDEVRIDKRVLSADEIYNLYQSY
jgi:hypothetical protein